MESRFQTSFIPKKPIEPVSSEISSDRQPLGLFFSAAVFITIMTLLAAGGVFAYSQILGKEITNKQQSLQSSEKEFDPSLVTQLERLDDRIQSAGTLLSNHIGFSTFFTLLQNDTLKTIQYTNFQYTYAGPNKVSVTLSGVAQDYASVARQSEIFSDATYTHGYIQSPIFSDLNIDQSGNVVFSLTALISPDLISYKKNLLPTNSGATDATDTVSAAPAPSTPAAPANPSAGQSQPDVVTNP
jgi:hypothetical protein